MKQTLSRQRRQKFDLKDFDKDTGRTLPQLNANHFLFQKQKAGTLKSGRSGKTVKSHKQAVAIGLSEARKKGAKVPPRKS